MRRDMRQWGKMRQIRLAVVHTSSPDSESNMAANKHEVLLALAHRNHLVAVVLVKMEENERNEWVNRLWQLSFLLK